MWLNEALLCLATLSLHIGFGLALGSLVQHARKQERGRTRALLPAVFFGLVFLPGCIVLLELDLLPLAGRVVSLLPGLIAAGLPLSRALKLPDFSRVATLRQIYPALSMFLLAIWGLIAFLTEGLISAAPLALTSSLAGIAALRAPFDPA